ncbi:ArsR/SmtB family transcription factor [Stackebrandtia endophytica]|uniref:ArsR/SmtB family transcription factor n=1 Tax=Stackebrandtia endophytica TaxID=1496996 RepID=UPI001477244F|nr:winged helix-turn-helix domain-containing protein [Stackebrandtia endophytica]
MSDEKETTEWADRPLRDAGAVKAIAHPLRLRLLELLGIGGPATATDLAARVGESPANCSWHLRQLAAHGFIEETGEGRGRQRFWRLVPESTSFNDDTDDPELAAASQAGGTAFLEYMIGELRRWRIDRQSEPAQWRRSSFHNQAISYLTPEELSQLAEDIRVLFTKYVDRITDPSSRPADSRPVRLYADGFPSRGLEETDTAPDGPSA